MEAKLEPEIKIEYQILYRGYILKVTQNQKWKAWTLSYSLGNNLSVHSKFRWQAYQDAIDHGKRMIDSLFDE